jgi:hypothetical protein
MAPAPKRSWCSYSLRTLFVVVTVFGIWLGWELESIRARKEFLATDPARIAGMAYEEIYAPLIPYPTIPFWRAWLGDKPQATINISSTSPIEDFERAKGLFSEALILSIESDTDPRLAFRRPAKPDTTK